MVDTPIGTNSPNYTLVSGDVGATVFCRVTATNASGSAQAFSNAVGPVVAGGGGDVTAPTITSSATVSNVENSALAHTLTANETVTWSKIGGADAAKFTLTGAVLSWTSSTKDFETPDDADANNAYIVQVRATDTASNTTDQTITVTVTDVAEGAGPATTNLWTWLKADAGVYSDAGTTPATNGGTVQRWADSHTGARHFNQTTAGNRPTWVTNAINTTLPVLRFNGAPGSPAINQYLIGPSAAALTAGEIFLVVKKAGTDPGDGSQAALWDFSSNGQQNLYPYSDGHIYDGWGSDARKDTGDPTPSLTAWRLYNVVSTASEWTSFIDGTQYFPTGSNVVQFASTPYLAADIGSGASASFDGDIAELIMYSAKCSAPDKAQTKSYLATKYGLTIA